MLVDTPGLNDTDQFHDYLSYEESLEADCVIFVMDARDPGSNSELSLLRKLARSGRTVSIIGVLTNIDRLNSAASLEAAREQARTVLREACRSSGHVELAGVVALNTRQAVEERCRGGSAFSETLSKVSRSVSGCGELEQLLALLREIMDRDAGKEAYRHKIAEAYSRIGRLRPRTAPPACAGVPRIPAEPRTGSVCWTRTPNSFPPPPSPRWSRPGRS